VNVGFYFNENPEYLLNAESRLAYDRGELGIVGDVVVSLGQSLHDLCISLLDHLVAHSFDLRARFRGNIREARVIAKILDPFNKLPNQVNSEKVFRDESRKALVLESLLGGLRGFLNTLGKLANLRGIAKPVLCRESHVTGGLSHKVLGHVRDVVVLPPDGPAL
jgi:hypothetical protein